MKTYRDEHGASYVVYPDGNHRRAEWLDKFMTVDELTRAQLMQRLKMPSVCQENTKRLRERLRKVNQGDILTSHRNGTEHAALPAASQGVATTPTMNPVGSGKQQRRG